MANKAFEVGADTGKTDLYLETRTVYFRNGLYTPLNIDASPISFYIRKFDSSSDTSGHIVGDSSRFPMHPRVGYYWANFIVGDVGSYNIFWNYTIDGTDRTYSEAFDSVFKSPFGPMEPTKFAVAPPSNGYNPIWPSGFQGVAGPQGPMGPQGAFGGPQGSTGAQGAAGVQGFQGVQGFGATGFQGATGPQGTGPQGVQGRIGSTGPQGDAGPQGNQGNYGSQGTQGIAGPQGIQGMTGPQGDMGIQGPQGLGIQGFQGSAGSQGPTGSAGGVAGGIFITDVVPQSSGNVGNKIYSSDGTVLESCTTSTTNLSVSVLALTGVTHYKPVVSVDGTSVTNLIAGPDKPLWTGSVDIAIPGTKTIEALHEDGAFDYCSVTYQVAPQVTAAVFTGGYPGAQTELKENDTVNLQVSSDATMSSIVILDYGVGKDQTFSFAPTMSKIISVTVADRGDTTQLLSSRLRVADPYGAYGNVYDTSSGGSVDGTNKMTLNNIYPTVTYGTISYPATQSALKDSESASVAVTISDTDTISFTSPNGDLSITNPTTIEPSKTVQRISGTYNISTTNLRATAVRVANASTTISNAVVYIAHSAASITVAEPYSRLRSGGNAGTSAQNYTITVTSDQNLSTAPSLTAPAGTWQGAGFAGGPLAWTRALQVHDNDTKGAYTWTGLSATNLAGVVTSSITGDDQYTLGGFVFRTMTIAAWPNREGSIGTYVSNTSKLRCTNLSKGASGSLNFTFQASTSSAVDRYTITNPSGIYNASGNLWYDCDTANATSNTSGTMQVELEEIV